jgi:hypothetical protein
VLENSQGFDAGTIDGTGLYTAPQNADGTFHVVATSQADATAQGIAAVNVPVPAVAISPATATLAPGGSQTFTSTVTGLPDTGVGWTVQESAGGIVTSAGIYTAPSALGFFHVVATSLADTAFSSTATITVTTSSSRFTPTGDMQNGRGLHTATLLTNGKVLMAGGAEATGEHRMICIVGITSAELFDPISGSFIATGSMTTLRYAHTATLLQTGEVLILGGFGGLGGVDCEDAGPEPAQNNAELFDSATGSFKATGKMVVGRGGHTATLLADGKVLIVGGGDQGGGGSYGTGYASAEVYDASSGVFSATGNMSEARFGHTATLLADGKVLIVGGLASQSSNPTASAELYDPATGLFSPTGMMATPRRGHTATLLADGRVLITGGVSIINGQSGATSTAEIYDSGAGSFSLTSPMGTTRSEHTATQLPNGMVLVTGGGSPTAELYDPSTSLFSPTGSMETDRSGHSATLLQNGMVLVAGGGPRPPLASAELYK